MNEKQTLCFCFCFCFCFRFRELLKLRCGIERIKENIVEYSGAKPLETKSKKLLLILGAIFACVSALSSYLAYNQVDKIFFFFCWVIGPIIGLFELIQLSQDKRMKLWLFAAEPDELDKRRIIALVAIIFTAAPALFAIKFL